MGEHPLIAVGNPRYREKNHDKDGGGSQHEGEILISVPHGKITSGRANTPATMVDLLRVR